MLRKRTSVSTKPIERDTYLSIDLDFWDAKSYSTDRSIRRFFKRLPQVPTTLVEYHHEMLPHVNKVRLKRLLNVDFHSDLAGVGPGRSRPSLNEGTWVDHVRWRRQGEFVWHCPDKAYCYFSAAGRCDDSSFGDVFKDPKRHDWKKVRIQGSLRGIDMRRVARIGISLSLDWINTDYPKAILPFLDTLDKELSLKLREFLVEQDVSREGHLVW